MDRSRAVGVRGILFTDMVGSSELRSRLGDDRADDLRRDHDAMLGSAVAAHGGRGAALDRRRGEGRRSRPRRPRSRPPSTMQRAVAPYGRGADAVAPVPDPHRAQRRRGDRRGRRRPRRRRDRGARGSRRWPRPGEILATDLVQRLGAAAGRRRASRRSASHTLKGLDQPVTVVRVVDTAADARRPPGPAGAGRSTAASRWSGGPTSVAAALAAVGRRCRSGTRGDGARHRAAGHRQVAASSPRSPTRRTPTARSCSPASATASWRCRTSRSRWRSRDGPSADDELASAVATGAGPLGPLFPARRARPLRRRRAVGPLRAVRGRRRRWSTGSPTSSRSCWCSRTCSGPRRRRCSCCATSSGTRREARVLLLGSYRDEEVGAAPSAARPARRDPRVDRGDEARARRAAAARRRRAGRRPGAGRPRGDVGGFARRVRDESAGSPFFVCELLHHLSATGELERLVTDGQRRRAARSPTRCATSSASGSAGCPTTPASSCPPRR